MIDRVHAPAALRNAYVKVERARHHLDELDDAIRTLQTGADASLCVVHRDDQTLLIADRLSPLPLELGVMFGECAEQLRSALDYMVNELAVLNGKTARRASFPIVVDETAWPGEAKRLKTLSVQHRAAVRDLQPFNDPRPDEHPLAQLQWVSNSDKHRDLLPSWSLPEEQATQIVPEKPVYDLGVSAHEGPIAEGDIVLIVETTPPGRVRLKSALKLDVRFGDRLLGRVHLENAARYVLWVLSLFGQAWGIPMADTTKDWGSVRVSSGFPQRDGTMQLEYETHAGQSAVASGPIVIVRHQHVPGTRIPGMREVSEGVVDQPAENQG
jgi:hypothetical protein